MTVTDRPTAETINALQGVQSDAQRAADDVVESVATEVQRVVETLHATRRNDAKQAAEAVGQHGLDMLAAVRQAFDAVGEAVGGEVDALEHLLRDGPDAPTGAGPVPGTTPWPSRQFENRDPDALAEELAHAERHGVHAVHVDDEEFDETVNAGAVKWAVLPDGELVVIPKKIEGADEFSHAVLSQGLPVLAAGEANLAGSADTAYFGLTISNHSGHFEPPPETLEIGLAAFADSGIPFAEEGQERKNG